MYSLLAGLGVFPLFPLSFNGISQKRHTSPPAYPWEGGGGARGRETPTGWGMETFDISNYNGIYTPVKETLIYLLVIDH